MFEQMPQQGEVTTLRRRVLLALREVALIVIAVLIAIALESLWQYRQDRTEEDELLAALLEEMRRNSAELQRWIALHEMVQSSAEELARVAGPTPLGTSILVADTLISDIIRTPTYQPHLSVFRTAQSSGTIALLRSLALRRDLDRWFRDYEEAQEDELKGLQFVESQLIPHLMEVVDLAAPHRALVEFVEAHSAGRQTPVRTVSASTLRVEGVLGNLLSRRVFFAGFAIAELRVLQESLGRITEEIERELDAR